MLVKITRACGETDRALLFRGWSRLCLHAATLSAAEGASVAAMVFARAARAEAMDREAEDTADKAEARRRSAATSEETTEARDKAQSGTGEVSTLTTELRQRGEGTERMARDQQLRRIKILVSTERNHWYTSSTMLKRAQDLTCDPKIGALAHMQRCKIRSSATDL